MSGFDQVTWTDLWADATNELGDSDEARHIIEAASGRSGASWLITLDQPAPTIAGERVHQMIRRRVAGEPLQYVLGRWGFRGLNLKVDRRVLIPRPETEQVVEAAIRAVRNIRNPTIVDLGTGSGAIALSLALELPAAEVWATDFSAEALEVATSNLGELAPEAAARVHLLQGFWFEALPSGLAGKVDMIVSNPPYVGEDERSTLGAVVLNWEPSQALFGGADGLDDITHIVGAAVKWLSPQGVLVVEIAPRQAEAVESLASQAGFPNVSIGSDFAGRKRWLMAKRA